jgi:hypothetical protein
MADNVVSQALRYKYADLATRGRVFRLMAWNAEVYDTYLELFYLGKSTMQAMIKGEYK